MFAQMFKDGEEKVRPGTYTNYKAKASNSIKKTTRGVTMLPFLGYDWGENGKIYKVTNEAPDEFKTEFGRSVTSDNGFMKMLRLAMKKSNTVYVYVLSGGEKAKVTAGSLTCTAKYGGTRGNSLKVESEEVIGEGFTVTVYLDNEKVEQFTGAQTVEDLLNADSDYVVFSGTETEELTEFAAKPLEGGTDSTNSNEEFVNYLDSVETINCQTAVIPVEDESLKEVAVAKAKYLTGEPGKNVQFVIPDCRANDPSVISVGNTFSDEDGVVDIKQACAWVAGATAAAEKSESLTHVQVEGATDVFGSEKHEEIVEEIKKGNFIFSKDDDGNVIVEYDINSLTNPGTGQNDSFKKNKVIRIMQAFAEDLRKNFPPNKFDGNDDGYELCEGLGRALLDSYENTEKVIKNVDYANDFKVNREESVGDTLVIDYAIQPVDSKEKIYLRGTIN